MRIVRLMRLFDFAGSLFRPMCFGLLAAVFSFAAGSAAAQDTAKLTPGIAWDVSGAWQLQGTHKPIHSGDAIEPASLLEPSQENTAHSITILLPDGQRILYECFTANDCARGFRVPELFRKPSAFAANMMQRIQAALVQQPPLVAAKHSPAGRDEMAAVMGPDNRIQISGLIGALSNGRYVYDLTPIRAPYPPQTGISFQKSGRSVSIKIPGPGLFSLKIVDPLKTPRIDYLIAAVQPAEKNTVVDAFGKGVALIEDWNGDYQGWPIHDFQRAYLESLMLNIRPAANARRNVPVSAVDGSDVTREPRFSPMPGVFGGGTSVALRSASPGSVIHYTFDASEPFNSSPEYHAPIMVKGTELTIKAFASSPGKRDSPVVTGIFRIANP